MKKILLVLAVVAMATNAVAQTAPRRVHVDASSVIGLAAGGAETARRAEAGVAELRALLSTTQSDLVQAQADIRIARSIGGVALTRAKQVEAALAAKVAELEVKLASEATKARADVDKAAIAATVEVVKTQHGVVTAPAIDAVAAAATPTPSVAGPARIQCPGGTAYRRISVTDGALRTGFREECLPIPGFISPEVMEESRTMPLWLKYSLFIVGGAATGAAGTYGVNTLGDGEGTASDIAFGAIGGAVVGGVICALTE